MSNTPEKLIQDLILFYVKENYTIYLKENNINKISEDKLESVVNNL